MPNKYSHVIWDWNGTLLDDLDWCITCTNTMLSARNLPLMDTTKRHHDIFCFPVRNYYESLGFDFKKESYEVLARQYMALYHSADEQNSKLHIGAAATIANIKERGITQIILSASKQENLEMQVKLFPEIQPYFKQMLGVGNIYAGGKIEVGRTFIQAEKPTKALMVGDTTHDFEVATAMGADCVLYTGGHQSKAELAKCDVPIVSSLCDILVYL